MELIRKPDLVQSENGLVIRQIPHTKRMVYQSGTSDVLLYKRSRHVSPEEQAQNDLNA